MLKDLNRVRHWVNVNSLALATTGRKYRIALYWAFTTMTTVGYGDIYIVNNTERFVAMFAMIVGGACFGYIIGGVTSILENLDLSSTMHNEKMDAIKEYLYDRQYPPILSAQVKKHFKNVFTAEGIFDMIAILETLPASTAVDLVCTSYKDLIYKTPFLRHANCDFVVSIVPSLFPCMANDGEFIFFEGSVGTHLYFINSGVVSIVIAALDACTCCQSDPDGRFAMKVPPSIGISCGSRGAGQLLGEIAIMLTFTNPMSACVMNRAGLYSMKKEALVATLARHENTRDELLRAACRMRQHISRCLKFERSKLVSGEISGYEFVEVSSSTLEMSSSAKLWRDHAIIHPEMPVKMVWDALICFLIIYSIVAITYTLSFGVEEPVCSWPSSGWAGLSCVW
mmetsp:Transcript_26176/g.78809  ORF Transcript_26176/g.78809 Transcript_26176/m.78809 type:complete len:397 (-) Transcript_26176:1365-2555(-)